MPQLELRCQCGTLRGAAQLAPRRFVRLACYCRDCQVFARALERVDVLDEYGGTEVVQMAPTRVELSGGVDQLACLRLSPKGLMRWYAACCNSPVANTLAKPGSPFVGLIRGFWGAELGAGQVDALLGPPGAKVNGPGHANDEGEMASIPAFPARAILRAVVLIGGSWVRREHRPTPFFTDGGEPVVTPRVLGLDERKALEASLPGAAA